MGPGLRNSETRMIPVRDHPDMLSAQYLASALRPNHQADMPVLQPARRREKKQMLLSCHCADVAPHLVAVVMPNKPVLQSRMLSVLLLSQRTGFADIGSK